MNWADVPLPELMKALDRDRRGLPIPFIVMRDKDGRPHFTINDDRKTSRCLKEDRCAICGNKLLRGRWFVGGPLAAFHEHGAYIDPPLHRECAEYALQVCPFLAAPHYGGRLEGATLDPAKMPDGMPAIFLDPTMIPDRPPLFVAVMATGQKLIDRPVQQYVKPKRPYLQVQYWQHGQRLDAKIGEQLRDEALAALNEQEENDRRKVLTRGGSEQRDRF